MVAATSEADTDSTVASHRVGAVHRVPDLQITDHWIDVPLDYTGADQCTITVFAREVVAAGSEEKALPWMVFLQGGPGFEAPRPSECSGWLKAATDSHRVLLLDQRGTGLSTPLTAGALAELGSAQAQAEYLSHFRADSIVRDAEALRAALLPAGDTWTVLGQSFGGFCAVSYLSLAPQGLRRVLLTGGLPPIQQGCTAEAVYRACFKRVAAQTTKYYARFPDDEQRMRDLVLFLDQQPGGGVALPSGSVLTPRGLQVLGLAGLGSSGGFERLHYLLERAWEVSLVAASPHEGEGEGKGEAEAVNGGEGAQNSKNMTRKKKQKLSSTFLSMFDRWLDFDTNPLYAVLHEAIYCQGAASQWAAERVRAALGDEFDAVRAAREGRPVPFTGEMIFPWMFDEWASLRPLKEAANLLAQKSDWPSLYDRAALKSNSVPVAAAMYYEDLYVDRQLSEETAASIAGIRLFVTNEYMHSGIREDGPRILSRLLGMLDGKLPLN